MNMAKILLVNCGGIGWVLWGLSVVTVAMIVQVFVSIRRSNILPAEVRAQLEDLFGKGQYREAIELAAADPSFMSYTLHAAMSEALHGYPAMERAMEEAADERTAKLLRQVEWLNLMGNVSPMLGLMGTVWGMILAFFKIVEKKGTPDPGDLAGAIGIALVTTLLGLSVAIPALAVYGLMRNRIDALSSEAIMAVQGLISRFRPAAKKAAGEKAPEQA